MSIFHACDIRGIAGKDLNDVMTRRIALAIGVKLTGQRVVVGGGYSPVHTGIAKYYD